jgi:hypothetical protein
MTATEISKRIQQEADARFGDTIEKMMLILRHRHTHQCWRKECRCGYCQFINGQYVNEKLKLHQMKKRIRHYEYLFYLTESEMHGMMSVEMLAARQKMVIRCLKDHKKELQKEIL